MLERPVVKFAIGGLLGGVASLSISVALMAFIAAAALALLFGIASRSYSVLCGVLCGFGLTWLVLIGSNYTNCVSIGPNCQGSEGMVPFLVVAGLVFLTGVAVGVLGIARDRAKRQSLSA